MGCDKAVSFDKQNSKEDNILSFLEDLGSDVLLTTYRASVILQIQIGIISKAVENKIEYNLSS